MPFLADCSLSLINRTGAHYVAREIVDHLPAQFSAIRHWRLLSKDPPADLARKICGRLMLKEIQTLGARSILQWPRPDPRQPTLFMDPLYVLRAQLEPMDIVLCHDVGPVSHPELYDPVTTQMYRDAYAKIQEVAPGIVFVSEASRRAFVERYASQYRFLHVIALFARHGSTEGPEAAVPGIRPRFLLTVGAFERRKNHLRSIEAFRASGLAEQGIDFVLCGASGLDKDAIYSAAEQTPGIVALNYVSEPQLRWLYRNAQAFVLPSLLEGFGMPALEAAHHGLLPVVSAGGALEEAVGGLGLGVDPLSVESIAQGLRDAVARTPQQRLEISDRLRDFARRSSRECFLEQWESLLRNNNPSQDTTL